MATRKNSRKKETRSSYEFLVSSCLAGINCNHKSGNDLALRVKRMVAQGSALPVCPEVLGGQPIPRPGCEISGGDGADLIAGNAKALTASGLDVSKTLLLGARRAVSFAKRYGITKAILKSNSPSCGCGYIYDGSFSRRLKAGDGVTAALMRRNKIAVFTEKDFKLCRQKYTA